MRTANLLDAYPTFFDLNGKPLMGRIRVFVNETREYAELWLDPSGTTRAANPIRTNGAGKTENQVFVEMPESGQKIYTVSVQEFLGKQYSDMDEYWNDDEMWKDLYDFKLVVDAGNGVKSSTVSSVSEIAGAETKTGIVLATGFYNAGDCPARVFVYTEKAIFPEDGCTSIKSKDGGYWTWFPEPVVDSGCFGIIPSADKGDISSGLLSLQSFLASSDVIKKVCFRKGTYFMTVDATLPCQLEFKTGAKLTPLADVSLSCRSVSAPSGFIKKFLSSSTYGLTLSVSEGEYCLSWYDSAFSSISVFGTPSDIVIDRKMDTSVFSYKDIRFVKTSANNTLRLPGVPVAFTGCRFDGRQCLDLSVATPTFSVCGNVRTSSVCDGFKASFINSGFSTRFIVDSTIEMDEDLSQESTGFTVEDGAWFNGLASPGTLTINGSSLKDGVLSCETKFVGIEEIRFAWFRDNLVSDNRLINSMITSGIYSVDLCGRTFGQQTIAEDCVFRNGKLSGTTFTGKVTLSNVSGSSVKAKGKINVQSCSLQFDTFSVQQVVAENSILSGDNLTSNGLFSASDSVFRFTTNVITGGPMTVHNTDFSGKGSVTVSSATISNCSLGNLSLTTEKIKATGADAELLGFTDGTVNASKDRTGETIHDNASESMIRKTVSFTDGFMGREEEENRLYDVNAGLRFNGGIYCAASKGRTKFDIFSLIPSMPTFIVQDDYVSLVDELGSSRDFKYNDHDTVITKTAYGIIGKTRPKPGQLLFIVPTDDNQYARCLIARSLRSASFDGTSDLSNKDGGLQDTATNQLFPSEVVGLKLIENDGPIVLMCLGPGYLGDNSVPIFWNLNGTRIDVWE